MFGTRGGKGGGVGLGFNLIALLVVVVILGISAAVAVSSLSGTTSGSSPGISARTTVGTTAGALGTIDTQSAIAACQSNATEVDTALQEYSAVHGVPSASVTAAELISGPSPFLVSFPSSPSYAISIDSGVVMIAAPKTSAPVPYGSPTACAKAGS
jgi:hypothetical protein